ncbi:hypothetical protein FA95DRAFT_1142540, partial [Auriscalpium vulgare]
MSQSDRGVKQYWYPEMGNQDIIASLDAWGLPVTQQQLLRPTPEFVMAVYAACVQQVSGLSETSLDSSVHAALASLEEPSTDIYASSLSTNLFNYHITRFANAAKVPDFSSRDVFFPTPERTRLILSAFINLVKFSEQQEEFVSGLRGKSTKLVDEREKVTADLARVQAQLAQIRAKRAEDEPLCQELRKENIEITAQVIAAKDIQTSLL